MAFAREIAAATVYMEASGEPSLGRQAVAHVLVNRVADGRWGSSLASVCLARAQFSCWDERDPNRMRLARLADTDAILLECLAFVDAAVAGEPDPTGGATFYYADTMPNPPSWASQGTFTAQIGHHRFYKDVP